jgi:hypothetical protein
MAEPSYAFLLRCWKEPDEDAEHFWHFLLINIDEKQEKKSFTDLEAVVAYLQQTLEIVDRPDSQKSSAEEGSLQNE